MAVAAPELVGVSESRIITIDNGGTNTRVAVAIGGEQLGRIVQYDTPQNHRTAIERIGQAAQSLLEGQKPDAIGISVAGQMTDGRITQAGKLAEYGWVGLPFTEAIASEVGINPERIADLNDCSAGANSERKSRLLRFGEVSAFMVVSTGLGGALYTAHDILPDEPGHHYLKPGALCGDEQEGHIEAHVAGSGIEKKFGVRGEDIPHGDPRWQEIKTDFLNGMILTLDRYDREMGVRLGTLGFTGSVALRGPDMLGGLQQGLSYHYGFRAPMVAEAVHGEESGLYGALFAAADLLQAI